MLILLIFVNLVVISNLDIVILLFRHICSMTFIDLISVNVIEYGVLVNWLMLHANVWMLSWCVDLIYILSWSKLFWYQLLSSEYQGISINAMKIIAVLYIYMCIFLCIYLKYFSCCKYSSFLFYSYFFILYSYCTHSSLWTKRFLHLVGKGGGDNLSYQKLETTNLKWNLHHMLLEKYCM